MKKGATPSLIFGIDIDLRQAQVYITFSQKNKVVFEKTNIDGGLIVDEDTITCLMYQDDTLDLSLGDLEMQLAYIFADGKVDKSDIIKTTVERVLKEGKIVWNSD